MVAFSKSKMIGVVDNENHGKYWADLLVCVNKKITTSETQGVETEEAAVSVLVFSVSFNSGNA